MSKKLRVALIGGGMIANAAHIPAYLNLKDDVEIVAVASTPLETAKATAERFGIPAYFEDAESMLAAAHPDLVSICTPNILHKPLSLLALRYGAHVICEKPLAIAYADAAEMFAAAKAAGKLLVASQTIRYKPEHLVAHDIAKGGALGDIYYAELSRIRRRGVPMWGSFHKKDVNGGGALCDIGVHLLDSILWIMGNPKMEAVTGVMTNRLTRHGEPLVSSLVEAGAPAGVFGVKASYKPEEFETEEFGAGAVRLAGGCMLNFKVGWAANLPNSTSMTVVGDKAGLQVPELNVIGSFEGYQADTQPRWFDEGRYKDKPFSGHWYLIENVVDAIRGRAALCVKPEETLNVTAIIDAFYKSAALHREVRFEEISGEGTRL